MKYIFILSVTFFFVEVSAQTKKQVDAPKSWQQIGVARYPYLMNHSLKPDSIPAKESYWNSRVDNQGNAINVEMPINWLASSYYFKTPVFGMNGTNNAPMPGTEGLDSLSRVSGSTVSPKSKKVKIQVFPVQ